MSKKKSAIEAGRIETAAHQAVDDLRILRPQGRFFGWERFGQEVESQLRDQEDEKLEKRLYNRFWADVKKLKIAAKKIAQRMLKEME